LERNIKSVRVRRKQLELLQDSYQVDCFSVNAEYFKSSMDDLLAGLVDQMTDSLTESLE